MYRSIFVKSLHTLTSLLCFPGLYINSNLSSHVTFPRLQPEKKNVLCTCVQVITPFVILWCDWTACCLVKISWTCSILPSCRMVTKLKWGHGVHICYLVWIICGSFVLFAVKSLCSVMSLKNNPEYSEDLYCVKSMFHFLRFLWGCHHRWSNEDFYDISLL